MDAFALAQLIRKFIAEESAKVPFPHLTPSSPLGTLESLAEFLENNTEVN